MALLPVVLDLAGVPCLVVGAGQVGTRRARTFADAGGEVTLVDPAPSPGAVELAAREPSDDQGAVLLLRASYEPGMLAGIRLVSPCTNDPAMNGRIARDARAAGAWVNAAGDSPSGDLMLPASWQQGRLTITVHTGGAAPSLSRRILEALSRVVEPHWPGWARLLAEQRRTAQAVIRNPEIRAGILKRAASDEGERVLLERGEEGFRTWLKGLIEAGSA